ncbi:MAG: hypothetical protein ABWX62_04130 [Microterricola sp.]
MQNLSEVTTLAILRENEELFARELEHRRVARERAAEQRAEQRVEKRRAAEAVAGGAARRRWVFWRRGRMSVHRATMNT